MTVAGFTSTGSKHPAALFGADAQGVPLRMVRSRGCMTYSADGTEYLDFVMALGAVGLGYGQPAVEEAVIDAVRRGGIGALAPQDEAELAAELAAVMPWLEEVRFLKSGAEAVAAAVRIARVATGRDAVLGCGYHGWLDWCNAASGVPAATREQFAMIPFNDPEAARAAIAVTGDRLACIVVEPVIDGEPSREWLNTLRLESARTGAVLIFDEIKTAFRIALGGATERWGVEPDLTVLGKALANGYPLAVVGGRRAVMGAVGRTWISSTMATEFVSIAAARTTVRLMRTHSVPRYLGDIGGRLFAGLQRLATQYQDRGISAAGMPEMCYLRFDSDTMSARVATQCAHRRLLFKRTAYNFVSLAHDGPTVDRALEILGEVLAAC